MMKKSPVYPNYETSDYGDYEFDPELDFTQFLEEARQHAREMNLQNLVAQAEEAGKGRSGQAKKSKKSWKNSLFKWWKSDNKKSEASKERETSSHVSKPRKGHVSGPIYGSGRAEETKHRRQTSGRLLTFSTLQREWGVRYHICILISLKILMVLKHTDLFTW